MTLAFKALSLVFCWLLHVSYFLFLFNFLVPCKIVGNTVFASGSSL